MEITYRSSFSQHNSFQQCIKSWFWSSILKIPSVGDYTYANAGTCVHKCLDKYYNGEKDIPTIKQDFEDRWKSFKLDESDIKLKKDEYWGMILNGINLNKNLTSTEMKIFYPEVVAYLDGVNTNEDEILDWKTSTRSPENEEEYRQQLLFYNWLYFRKIGRIPKKSTVHYLKYSGSKGELSFSFTEDDIKQIEKWFYDILEKMQYYIANPDKLPPFNRNYHWCPYKSSWDTENQGDAKYTLHIFGNYIQLEGYIPELLEKGIKKKFSYELKNAHWIKKAKPMAKTTVEFWSVKNKTLPLGFKDGLLTTLQHFAEYKKIGLDLSVVDHRMFNATKVLLPDKFINNVTLRDYQNEAVSIFVRKKIGILELATGAGKTEIAIEILRMLGVKTLFIVDKKELMNQTKKRIEKALGIEVGEIGQGESNIKDVTVATIQTLNKRASEYREYLSQVRFVIFDETHKVAAKSYVKISKYLTGTEYRLGLSGTAFRDDGNDMMIQAVTGYIVHKIDSKSLIEKGWLVKPQITFIENYMTQTDVDRMEQQCKIGTINETPDYNLYYDTFILNNEYRNNKIIEKVTENKNKKILILTKLIDHGKMLNRLIPESQHLYGETPKEERKKMFDDFLNGNNSILISTISIFAEGIDIPSMNVVINAAANKGDVKTIQVLGRVLRTLEGKTNAQYIDFIDETKFFRFASISRRRALRRQGHEVDTV